MFKVRVPLLSTCALWWPWEHVFWIHALFIICMAYSWLESARLLAVLLGNSNSPSEIGDTGSLMIIEEERLLLGSLYDVLGYEYEHILPSSSAKIHCWHLKKIVLFLIYKNKHLTHLFEEGLQKLWNCQSIYEKANQLRCFHMYPFDLRRITSYMRLVHRI